MISGGGGAVVVKASCQTTVAVMAGMLWQR
jgi:hypothetical protein